MAHASMAAEGGVRSPDEFEWSPAAPSVVELEVEVGRDQERADHEASGEAAGGGGVAGEVQRQADAQGGEGVDCGVLVAVHGFRVPGVRVVACGERRWAVLQAGSMPVLLSGQVERLDPCTSSAMRGDFAVRCAHAAIDPDPCCSG